MTNDFDKTEYKIDNIKKEYTILDKYFPKIEANMKKGERTFFNHIAKYRDKNIYILSSVELNDYPKFSPEDKKVLFRILDIDETELNNDLLNVNLIKGSAIFLKIHSFQVLLLLLIKYYQDNKQEDKARMIYYYFGYSVYWIIYTTYFKFKPRPETMAYTINNLSNKFILKQTKSVDMFLYYTVEQTINTYMDRIKRCSDGELYYIIMAIRTRLNNYINKIKNEYMINDANKEVIFKGDALHEEGGERESSSITSIAESLSQEYTTKFFSSPPKQNIINNVAKFKGVNPTELKNTITILLDQQRIEEVRRFYAAIFYLYLGNNKTDSITINSKLFLGIMESIYKKGNSNDKNILKIKELMNIWLTEGSKTYRASNRNATLNDYRKAVYLYFVFSVVM